jgi:hypothetical protein
MIKVGQNQNSEIDGALGRPMVETALPLLSVTTVAFFAELVQVLQRV